MWTSRAVYASCLVVFLPDLLKTACRWDRCISYTWSDGESWWIVAITTTPGESFSLNLRLHNFNLVDYGGFRLRHLHQIEVTLEFAIRVEVDSSNQLRR